uniref:Uncharacterized protein n=1 Tax=Rhizophora mucronata TaxID=61149 RepID=A0A2P2P7I6_RHIMU
MIEWRKMMKVRRSTENKRKTHAHTHARTHTQRGGRQSD